MVHVRCILEIDHKNCTEARDEENWAFLYLEICQLGYSVEVRPYFSQFIFNRYKSDKVNSFAGPSSGWEGTIS